MKFKTGQSNGLIDVVDYVKHAVICFGAVLSMRYWLFDFGFLWNKMRVVHAVYLQAGNVQCESWVFKLFPCIARLLTTLRYISSLLFVFAFPLFDNGWYW